MEAQYIKVNGGEPQDQFELAPAKTVNLLQDRDIQKMFVCTHLLNFTWHISQALQGFVLTLQQGYMVVFGL